MFTTVSSEIHAKIACFVSISTKILAVKCLLCVFDQNRQFYVVYWTPLKVIIQKIIQNKLDGTAVCLQS
jgi:hypothetical protein